MKQFLLILKVILSNWKKTKGQLTFTILGIAIASTLWSSIDIVNNQTIKAQKRSIELLQSAFKPIIIDRVLLCKSGRFCTIALNGWLINPVIKATLSNSDITIIGTIFSRITKTSLSVKIILQLEIFETMQIVMI